MAKIKLHNPELAANSVFSNFIVESVISDPTVVGLKNAGRIWFNTNEKKLKGTFINQAGDALEIKSLADNADVAGINGSITAEVTRATTAEAALTNALNTEIAARIAGDSSLDTRVTAVESQVNGKVGDLTNLTTDAKDTIVAAVNEIDANINAEVARATAAEATLTNALNTETASRIAGDNLLDAALKTNGNNRKCYVRSDIVLHLTKELREKHGKEFMQFTGFSHGSIAAQEFDYKTNPLYPWLDNKTFNKWFVPDGADMPLGMMDIDKACRYDFRKDALDRLLSFLEEEKIIQKKSNITSKKYHRFTFFENFVLVGPTCAGKSTLANFLAEKFGYYHIEASDFMYQKYHQLHGAKPSVSIGDFAAKALEENICAVAKPIVKHVIGLGDTPFVISGFRHPQEIDCFLAEYKKESKILYIDASLDVRFERSIARKRIDDNPAKENFVAKNEQQMSMGLAKMGEEIGEKLLNESSIENYCLGFCTKYKDCLPDEIEIKKRISTKLTLEKAILVALYLSETNNGYTTTEIAKLILEKLNIVKSKNNVSRYFNQNIHPYYEIVEGSEPLKYKLNGTGESAARLVLSA